MHSPLRDAVFPPGRHALYERHRYSPAVRSGGWLFVSGQVGSREDGSPEPDLDAQVHRAFQNLQAVLQAAGDEWREQGRPLWALFAVPGLALDSLPA